LRTAVGAQCASARWCGRFLSFYTVVFARPNTVRPNTVVFARPNTVVFARPNTVAIRKTHQIVVCFWGSVEIEAFYHPVDLSCGHD